MTTISKFKNVCVRGRYAYAIFCLEAYFKQKKYDTIPTNLILNTLWTAVEKQGYLDDFYIIIEVIPECIIEDKKLDFPDFETPKKDCLLLYDFYKDKLEELNDVIDAITYIFRTSLHTTIQDDSTLEFLSEVLHFMDKHQVALPCYDKILTYSMEENGGWGYPRSREDLRC